ncbi:hypothetical protein BSL78_01707 [Apostichopus japonicus]|uniref:P2X purinoreceptor 7 intracellular domain-containing protein n=1 Tax=Stichopus japonicus TaxID=307972 RepID=A0A2G8LM76_STIJA|nr:hypothetical protein BSL78_01707 [Apostichopus japonicus]
MESGPEPYAFQPVRQRARPSDSTSTSSANPHDSTVSVSAIVTNVSAVHELPSSLDARLSNLDWCICGGCMKMPTTKECLCCSEMSALNDRVNDMGFESNNCIANHTDFPVLCLNSRVLRTNYIMQRHVRGDDTALPNQLPNRKYRFIAYRAFTAWSHGRLWKRNRCIIPACAVAAIRASFPGADGNYKGYQDISEVREALQMN